MFLFINMTILFAFTLNLEWYTWPTQFPKTGKAGITAICFLQECYVYFQLLQIRHNLSFNDNLRGLMGLSITSLDCPTIIIYEGQMKSKNRYQTVWMFVHTHKYTFEKFTAAISRKKKRKWRSKCSQPHVPRHANCLYHKPLFV